MRRALTPAIVLLAFTFACGGSGSDDAPTGGRGGGFAGSGGSGSPSPPASGAGIGGSSTLGAGGSLAGALGVSGGGAGGASSLGGSGNSRGGGANAGAGTSSGAGRSSGGASASAGAASAGAPSGGSGGGTPSACTREALQAAAKSLAEALAAKDSSKLALDSAAKYFENMKASEFGKGVWQNALTIALQRDFLDVEECQTFSEIIVTEGVKHVLGVRLQLAAGTISEVHALVTNKENGWAFNADNYFKYSKAEDWSVIPEADRDARDVLIAGGNAYFDRFSDENAAVPWGIPCARLEGGAYTNPSNSATATCEVGIPEQTVTFADKHWVVDRKLGTAIGIVRFGGTGGLPDSHMFRLLKGKLRYVHTITVCPEGGCNVGG